MEVQFNPSDARYFSQASLSSDDCIWQGVEECHMPKRQKKLWWLWWHLQNMNLVSLQKTYIFRESRPCDENWGLLVSSRWGVGHPGFAWKLDFSSRRGLHDSNDDRVHCHMHFRFDKIFGTMNPSYIHNQYSVAHAQIDWKKTITIESFQAKPLSRTNLAFQIQASVGPYTPALLIMMNCWHPPFACHSPNYAPKTECQELLKLMPTQFCLNSLDHGLNLLQLPHVVVKNNVKFASLSIFQETLQGVKPLGRAKGTGAEGCFFFGGGTKRPSATLPLFLFFYDPSITFVRYV